MSAAEQAFLLTGELFVLSFVAIYAFWFADKLRRNFTGSRQIQSGSPDGAERNPGSFARLKVPDFAALHPGYGSRPRSAARPSSA